VWPHNVLQRFAVQQTSTIAFIGHRQTAFSSLCCDLCQAAAAAAAAAVGLAHTVQVALQLENTAWTHAAESSHSCIYLLTHFHQIEHFNHTVSTNKLLNWQ
jgi:hypothetical protein